MHNLPSAADLVESVAEWLEGPLAATLTGAERFNVRVAANSLRIVERELRAGPVHHAADRVAFAALAPDLADEASDEKRVAALAGEVRSGALDSRTPQVLAVLHAYAVRKLQITNPRYLSAQDAPAASSGGS